MTANNPRPEPYEKAAAARRRLAADQRDRAQRTVRRATAWVAAMAAVATGVLVGIAAHDTALHGTAGASTAGGSTGSGPGSGSSLSVGPSASSGGSSSGSSSGGTAPAPSSGPAQAVTGQS